MVNEAVFTHGLIVQAFTGHVPETGSGTLQRHMARQLNVYL